MALTFPNIDPVAFTVFSFPVRWYGISYFGSFLFCWWYANFLIKRLGTKTKITPQHIEDFIVWCVIAVILGGRLGYILFYQPAMFLNPVEILTVWHGGMSFHGAYIGVGLATLLFAKKHKLSFFALSDIVALTTPFGLFWGRIANFINQELVGRVTDTPWGVIFPLHDSYPRHPSQLYEAFLEGAVLFLILNILHYKYNSYTKSPGRVTALYVILYAIFRFTVEFFREPDAHIGYLFSYFSMGQFYSMLILLFGLWLYWIATRKAK